jgi:hypothetical protein
MHSAVQAMMVGYTGDVIGEREILRSCLLGSDMRNAY